MRQIAAILLVAFLAGGCAATPEGEIVRLQEPGPGEGGSEDRPAPEAGLDGYVRYALRHNPGLGAAFDRWQAAREQVAPAGGLSDPRFTYGHFVRQVETRVGPQEHRFSLMQTFPWPGELDLKGRMARQMAEAERLRYEAARNDLVFRVKEAYYELYYLEQAIRITWSSAQLLTYLEEVARAGYRSGAARHAAVIKAQIERAGLEDRLRGLEQMRRPLAARFNAALGRDAAEPVAVDSALPEARLRESEEELAARVRSAHPELKALAVQAERGALAVELAKKDGYPDLTLGVDYIATGEARGAGMAPPPDSGKDPVVAAISINLPLWRGQYRARQREALTRQRAVLQEWEDRESRLLAALELALYGLRDGERRIALYQNSLIPRAEQALGVSQQAFAAGQGTFLDLIDAQRTLLEFRLAYERAVADRASRLAEIDRLAGGPARGEEGEP